MKRAYRETTPPMERPEGLGPVLEGTIDERPSRAPHDPSYITIFGSDTDACRRYAILGVLPEDDGPLSQPLRTVLGVDIDSRVVSPSPSPTPMPEDISSGLYVDPAIALPSFFARLVQDNSWRVLSPPPRVEAGLPKCTLRNMDYIARLTGSKATSEYSTNQPPTPEPPVKVEAHQEDNAQPDIYQQLDRELTQQLEAARAAVDAAFTPVPGLGFLQQTQTAMRQPWLEAAVS